MEALVWRERLAHLDVDVDALHPSDEAGSKYWDMYRAIMRNDFAKASLHADSALAAEPARPRLPRKMIEAAWIMRPDDYRAAYNTATELVAEADYAAKYTKAMGLSGDERIAAAGKA